MVCSLSQVGSRFFVEVSVLSSNVPLLIDTGSQVNCLQVKYVPKDFEIQKSLFNVKSYSDENVEILGYIDTVLKIDNESWGNIRFLVVPNHLSSILGSRFIEDNEIIIVLKRRKLIKHGPIDRLVNLTLSPNNARVNEIMDVNQIWDAISENTITFKGRSETLIDLRVRSLNSAKTLFFEKSNLENSRLEFIPSMQDLDENMNIFRLLVVNPLESSIRIPAGTTFVKLSEAVEFAHVSALASQKTEEILSKIKIGSIPVDMLRKFKDLLKEFSHLFLDEEDLLPISKVGKFSIDTADHPPIALNPYRTPYALRSELKNILDDFERNKLIEKSNSPWNSPAILVRKKSGGFRLVIDFRRLNSITQQINHPLPVIEDVLNNLEQSSIFSVLDLKKGFHQLEVDENSKAKTAFSTEFGSYQWLRMPMGTRNSPSVFARVMDEVLKAIPKSEICCYLDDCLVHSSNNEKHFDNLRKFFIICSSNNLRLNANKAVFFSKKVDFLGFEVESGTIRPSRDRIEAIRNRDYPKNRDEAISLFGALGSHRRFIENFAELALPISQTYRGNFAWTQEASEAFEKIKEIICNRALELALPPSEGACFVLETDASELCLGGVLYNCEKGILGHDHDMNCLKPVAYFSQNLSECQKKYVTMEKELLAGKTCFEKWSVYLMYREFDWITDNSCVKYAQSFKTKNLKIQRWLSELAGYSYNLIQRKSKRMCISDYLSRSTSKKCKINQIKIEINELIQLQKADETLGTVYKFVKIDRWPNKFDLKISGYKRWRDLLRILETGELVLRDPLGFDRFCVPDSLKIEIIEEYHSSQHTGIDITFKRINKKYFWLDMKNSISNFIRSCHYCQTSKPCNNPNKAPLGKFKTPSAPYEALAFDLIGPLRETDQGNIHILTCIDMFSKRVYAEPLSCKDSHYLLEIFKKILFANPHFPKFVLMDNAQEFKKLASYIKEKGIEPHFSPPRHPQSNGLVENFNRSLKSRLRAKCNLENWDLFLYEVVHDCNSSEHSVVQMSPFAVEFGVRDAHNINDSSFRNYGNKVEIDFGKIREKIEDEKDERVKKFDNQNFREYQIGSKISIRNFRCKFPPFLGPMTVKDKSKNGTKYTCVDDKTGKEFQRHANDIRIYNLPNFEKRSQAEEVSRPLEHPVDKFCPNFEINEDNFSNIISPYFSINYDRPPNVTASPTNLDESCPSENSELSESESERPHTSEKSKIAKKDEKNEIPEDFEGKNELGPGIGEVNLETVTRFDNAENSEISEYSESSEISGNNELSDKSENSVDPDGSKCSEGSEKSVDSEGSGISESSKNTVYKSSSSDSSGDYVSKLPKPSGLSRPFNLDSSIESQALSASKNQAPRELELSNITQHNETNEIETPESTADEKSSNFESSGSDFPRNSDLDNPTETETNLTIGADKLVSFDKLDIPLFSNRKKRTREISKTPSPNKLHILDSDKFETRTDELTQGQSSEMDIDLNLSLNSKLENFRDQFLDENLAEIVRDLLEVRKLGLFESRSVFKGLFFPGNRNESDSEEDNDEQMSICIKFEHENEDLFKKIENEFETIKQNLVFDKGIMLKMSELTKPVLQYIATKFGIETYDGRKCKDSTKLKIQIRDFIRANYPNWNKSNSGEYLFFGIFLIQKVKTLSELSRPELKCLASSICLSGAVYYQKAKLTAAISDYFSSEKPLHPRNEKNELVFHPESAV